MEYKIQQEDLIGQIAGFPLEVVQRMVEEQVKQGNKADVSVFQENEINSVSEGGFDWRGTSEGNDFWNKVIVGKNFVLFFEKYPKRDTHVYYVGVKGRGNEIITELKKLGGKNESNLYGNDKTCCYYISPYNKQISAINNDDMDIVCFLLKECYTEKFLSEKINTIEIDGKKYNKKDVIERLDKLQPINSKKWIKLY